MSDAVQTTNDPTIEALFGVGAHFAFSRTRRHPTAAPYIFGVKNRVEIFDLAKTKTLLEAAKEFVKKKAAEGAVILLVSGKNEAREKIKEAAEALGMPFVASRWIGGTLTNFPVIRARVDKLLDLSAKREKGELAKYTKRERLLIDRDIARLEALFIGLVRLKEPPKLLFVIDPKQEKTAVTEARKMKIPVIALAGSDCDMSAADYPVVGNDAARASIAFFVDQIAEAYREGVSEKFKTQSAK